MKTLLLLRHAKSSWSDSSLSDHERPLNNRGQEAAPRMGQLIREMDLIPDLILSSTAVRARTTAALIAENSGYAGPIELKKNLYEANAERLVQEIAKTDDDHARVMVVAHNPGMDELLACLTRVDEHMPTASLAQISLPLDNWYDLGISTKGKLVQLWRPRELD